MGTTTTASPITPAEETTVPTLRVFQLDAGAIGRIAQSVNVFRGDVTLPLELVAISGRGGLEVKVTIAYQSDVLYGVDTWNVSAPTGLLGLGWGMAREQIVRDTGGSISPYAGRFYLLASDGSVNRLSLTRRTADEWAFELERYRFWDLRFFPQTSLWRITTEAGIVRTYGGTPDARQQGILWGGSEGNWTDSSVRSGQSPFDLAWDLSEIRNLWGEAITLEYEKIDLPIGTEALPGFTRASYLKAITDPAGRRISFVYGEKVYDAVRREYESPNQNPRGAGVLAFQDRFETRYLDAITVSGAGGTPAAATAIRLSYTLATVSEAVGDPVYLVKRYLRGITLVDANGTFVPGMEFDYAGLPGAPDGAGGDAAIHPGALARITYPEGGTATYAYQAQPIPGTERRRELTLEETSTGVPRVWFGPDYTVVTRYDTNAGRKLAVNVYDWNGRWIGSQPLAGFLPGELDLDTLEVQPRADWFLLTGKTTGEATGPALLAWAFSRCFGRFGDWAVEPLAMPSLALSEEYQVAAGASFVVAAATDQREIVRWRWDDRGRRWVSDPLWLDQAGAYSLAALDNYFTLAVYFATADQAALSLYALRAVDGVWSETPLDAFGPVLWQPSLPKLSWALSGSLAAATYLISKDEPARTVDYGVRIYGWDRSFANVDREVLPAATGSIDSLEPFAVSFAAKSLFANASRLRRYDATGWAAGAIGPFDQGKTPAAFAFADDLAIGTDDQVTRAVSYDPYSGSFLPEVVIAGGAGPSQPTIHGRYVTIRDRVYFRELRGELRQIGSLPGGADRVSNQGPDYVAYGLPDGASFVHLMKNGVLADAAVRLDEKLFPESVGPGQLLASQSSFATYTGDSFEQADRLFLYRLVDGSFRGSIEDRVVTAVAVADGLGGESVTTFAYTGTGTTGEFGLASQYSQARTIAGGDSVADAPGGYTVVDFHDGLSPAPDDPRPYALLSGLPRQKRLFDRGGRLVQEVRYEWEVVRRIADLAAGGAALDLVGGYARSSGQVTSTYAPDQPGIGPLDATEERLYDEGNGTVRTVRSFNYDALERRQTIAETTLFAYQSYPELVAAHAWTEPAQKTTAVDGTPTAIQATTWRPDWSAGTGRWAPYRTYQARSAAAVLTADDWANRTVADPGEWWLTDEVVARDPYGNVVERRGKTGLATATIFDIRGRAPVATFGDAALAEVTALGFESYESLQGWTLDGSADRLRAAIEPGDAHTGGSALRLAAGNGSGTLGKSLAIARPAGRRFVLCGWAKTPAAASGPAAARWTAPAGAAVLAELDLPATGGDWRFFFVAFDLPAGETPVTLALALANASGFALLVDDLRCSPLLANFKATVYDPVSFAEIATIAASGATSRVLRGSFADVLAEVAPQEAVTAVHGKFYSRSGGDGRFSPAAPNATLLLKPREWGFFQSFDLGPEWSREWSSATPGQWTTSGGALVHAAGAPGSIAFDALPAERRAFGMGIRAIGETALTGPLGLDLGGAALLWDPDRAAWGFDAGTGVSWQPQRSLLGLSWETWHGALDRGELPAGLADLFAAAALPLAPQSTVVPSRPGESWRLVDPGRIVYYLARDPNDPARIAVVAAPVWWVLYLRGRDAILFADGGRAWSARLAAPVTGRLGLRAADRVRFTNAVFVTGTELEVDYRDGADRAVQQQVADEDAFLASATLYDPAGRPAIATLLARLDPAPAALAAFAPGLAAFDWQTYTFSGLVADQNPAAGGYPYSRTRYEGSPLAREVQRGAAGADFAIQGEAGGAHTRRLEYGLNDGALGLTPGRYRRQTVIDPDGITRVDLEDLRGDVVRTGALARAEPAAWDLTVQVWDAARRLVTLITPMGYEVHSSYDFLGNLLTRESADTGRTERLYDSFGRPRFETTQAVPPPDPAPVPAQVANIRFWQYDRQSRTVAGGCFLHPWDAELQAHVDDPAWPAATPSDTFVYDGADRPDLLTLGRLAATTSTHQVARPDQSDSFAAVETLFYDPRGRTIRRRLRADAFHPVDYDVLTAYDNLDGVTATVTPAYDGTAGDTLGYRYDLVGRVAAIAISGATVAAYTYGLNGSVDREDLHDGGAVIGTSTFAYNPPGWITRIAGPAFSETLDYTTGGIGGQGYFNGSPARVTTGARGPNGEIVALYGYDRLGRLSGAQVQGNGATYGYDANGNLTRLEGTTLAYEGSDRVVRSAEAGASSSYGYDAGGNVVERTAAGGPPALSLTYDCFRGMPLDVSRGAGAGGVEAVAVALRYGSERRRLLRTVTAAAGTTSRLSLRGSGAEVVAELTGDGQAICYARGPRGLVALRVGGLPLFAATDHLGSIRAVFRPSLEVLGGYDYQPYGGAFGPEFGLDPGVIDLRFTDRVLDPSGLYDFRARLYDPRLGRFVSPDPKEQFPSPYLYAGNSPLLFTDPTGEFLEFLIAAIISAIIDAIVNVAIEIATGAAIGAVVGGVQAVVTIATNDLSGGQAAGVFFGFVGLGAVAGGVGGGAAGLVSVLTSTTAASVAAGALVGASVEALTGAALGAGQAALLGGDPGQGAAFGALAGAAGGGVSRFIGGFEVSALAKSSAWVAGGLTLGGNVAGGASGSLLSSAAQGKDASSILLDTLTGALYSPFSLLSGSLRLLAAPPRSQPQS